MANLAIYRNGTIIYNVTIDENTVYTGKIVAENEITAQFESPVSLDLLIGDYVIHNTKQYKLNRPAIETKESSILFRYEAVFEGLEYSLYNKVIEHLGTPDFSYFGTPEAFLDLIIENINTIDSGWQKGTVEVITEGKFISFEKESCRAALTKVAEAFELEFSFDGKVINLEKNIGELIDGLVFEYGRGNGLYSISRNPVNEDFFGTRFIGYGSTKNIPANYRGGKRRLSFNPGYVDRNTNIYGIIERPVVFENIFPQRTGTVSETENVNEIIDIYLDFNLNELIVQGQSKIVFKSGDLQGNEFEITSYNHTTKKITFNSIEEESGYVLPNSVVKAALGDEYTIVGIQMPQTYIDAAEIELRDATIEYAEKNKNPYFSYTLHIDEQFIRTQSLTGVLKRGDRIRVIDSDFNVDTELRITSISYPLSNPAKITAVISDEVVYTNSEKILKTIVKNNQQISITKKEISLNQIQSTRQNRKIQQEFNELVFNPDTGKFLNNKLDVDWLNAQIITSEIKANDFTLEIVFVTDFQGDVNALGWTSGRLVHKQLTDYQNGIWNFAAGSIDGLNPSQAYYIYLDAPHNGVGGGIFLDTQPLPIDNQEDYYLFFLGILSSVIDGFRSVSNTYGRTKINLGEIESGRLKNQSGQPVLDLDTRTFYGSFKFSNGDDVAQITEDIQNEIANQQGEIDAVLTLANNAQSAANTANAQLAILADDNILTPSEKQAVLREIQGINKEYPFILEQCVQVAVDSTYYTNAYNALTAYVNPLVANINIQSTINGNTFRSLFATYFEEKAIVLRDVVANNKDATDAADAKAQNALDNANEAKNFIDNVLPDTLTGLQSQIDGLIETWFYDYAPTLSNIPAVNWTTNAEKDKHLGDLFYNNIDGKGYRFAKNGTVYEWILLSDSDTAAALALAQQAKDTADSKRRVFGVQPFTPYDAGDLWVQGAGGDLMRCTTGRLTGSYNAADWALATKYTDDTVANDALNYADQAWNNANNAQYSADLANSALADIASDNVITPSEKQATLKEWLIIQGEKPTIVAQAQNYSLAYATYEAAYNTLSGYLSSLLADISVSSNIVGSTFRATFKAYYDARQDLLKLVSDAAKTLVNNISIGGRNLLRNSDFKAGLSNWNINGGTATVITIEGKKAILIKSSAYAHGIYSFNLLSVGLEAYTDYVISFDIKGQYYDQLNLLIGFNEFAPNLISVPNSDQWTRVFYSTKTGNFSGNDAVVIYGTGNQQDFYIANLKIEKGNKPTDWTPAPEDVEADYTTKVDAAQQAAQNYALVEAVLRREEAKAYADGIVTAEEQARLDQAAANLATAAADAQAKATAAANAVQVGGRNLIANSNTITGNFTFLNGSVATTNQPDPNGGNNATLLNLTNSSYDLYRQINLLKSNTEYTFSCYCKIDTASNFVVVINNTLSWTSFQNAQAVVSQSGWQRVVIKIVTDSSQGINIHFGAHDYGGAQQQAGTVYVYGLKLELGNKPTDWTPAVEDVQAGIDTAYNQATTALNTANTANAAAAAAQAAAAAAAAEASNAQSVAANVATKTNFLATTVDGNVVATGVMLVGDAAGNNNAGVSGVVDPTPGNSVRFWAGAPFANRNTAPFRVQQDGSFYSSKGTIAGFEINDIRIRHGSSSDYILIGGDLSNTKVLQAAKETPNGLAYALVQAGAIVSQQPNKDLTAVFSDGKTWLYGSVNHKTNISAAGYTLSKEDYFVLITSGGNVSLPANPDEGRSVKIAKNTSQTVTLLGNGKNIFARSSAAVTSVTLQWSMEFIYADGAWRLVNQIGLNE